MLSGEEAMCFAPTMFFAMCFATARILHKLFSHID